MALRLISSTKRNDGLVVARRLVQAATNVDGRAIRDLSDAFTNGFPAPPPSKRGTAASRTGHPAGARARRPSGTRPGGFGCTCRRCERLSHSCRSQAVKRALLTW